MNKKRYRKSFVILLVAALVVTSFPSYVFGYANTEDATQPVVATEDTSVDSIEAESGIKYDPDYKGTIQIEDELTSKRGEYEKHFVQSDGTAIAVSYPEKIHYKDENGVWQDIDSRLVLKDKEKGLYGPTSSDLNVSLSETATPDILVPASGDSKSAIIDLSSSYLAKITDGDDSISWNILGNSKDYTSDFLNKATKKTLDETEIPTADLVKDKQPDISKLSHDDQMTALPNLFSTATYKNVIKNVDVAVTVTPDKLKENLVINSPKGFESISYLINAGDLIGKITEDNSVTFSNEKGDVVFTIPTPLMLDSNTLPEESFDIGVALEKTTQGYILTLTPDSKWMNDPERVYPVILDPTVKTTRSQDNIIETYIHSGDDSGDHYTSSYIKIGETEGASCRGYVDFVNRPSIDTDLNDITGGDFIGYLVSGTSTYHQMKIYQPGSVWHASTIDWGNRPTSNDYLSIGTVTSSGGYYKYTFNVESSVEDWYDTGDNNGYMIKYTDEDIDDYNWFYSSDHPSISTSYYPCLSIEYAPDTLDPTISSFTVSPSTSSSNYTKDSTPTLTWVASDKHFKEIQYAIGSGSYTKISSSKSGSYTVPTGKVVSGSNAIKLRAVDKSGNYTTATVNYYYDNTAPSALTVTPASSTNWVKGEATLTATGTDANSGIDTSSYRFNGAVSNLSQSNQYKVTTPGANSITVSVKDKMGNQKTITGHKVYIDSSLPTVGSVTAYTNATLGTAIPLPGYSSNANPVFKLNDMVDTYSGLNTSGITYAIRQVNSTAALTYAALPSPVTSTIGGLTSVSAAIHIPQEGSYNIYFKVMDQVGNQAAMPAVTYTWDNSAPVLGSVSVSPATTSSTPTTTTNPTITWGAITEANLASVQYKVDNGAYKQMATTASGSFTLPLNAITSEGQHVIKIKAVDKAGNSVESENISYYMDDGIVLDSNNYLGDVSLVNYYGKNLIHWNPPTTIPSQVYYKVYRGTTADFTMDSSTLLAADLKTSYYVDMSVGGSGTYYYKVKVIKKNIYGDEVTSNVASSALSGTQKPISEFSSGIGQQSYMDYFTFGTPSGNGYIEKRFGNLGYTQQDYTLANGDFDYGLTRTYNSQSANTGMLGKGWSDSYHMELYTGSDGVIYFRQGDGTSYTFSQVAGGAYKCDQTLDYVLTVNAALDNDVKYRIETKDETTYDFNTYGQLIKATKPTGIALRYEYDSRGRLANVISLNSIGDAEKTIEMTYSQTSPYTLSKIVLPDLTERTYSVTSEGQLSSVTFSEGGFTGGGTTDNIVFNYGYDTNSGLLNLIKDGEQNTYSVEYTNGNATKITYPNNEYYQIGYTTDGNGNTINTVTKKLGSSVFYTEQAVLDNSTGKILTTTDASGITTQYEYTFSNHPLLVTQKTSQRFYETLDLGTGTVAFPSQPKIETTTIAYNADENVTSSVDAVTINGVSKTDSTVYAYTDSDNPNLPTQEATLVNGTAEEATTYTYDDAGRVTNEISDLAPETTGTDGVTDTSYQYIEAANSEVLEVQTSVEKEGENIENSTAKLDGEGCQKAVGTETLDNDGETVLTSDATTSTYDAMGRILSEVGLDGKTTTYCYDYLGRAISVAITQDSQTKTTTSSYNKNGSLTSTTDGMGITTAYTFDSLNRETGKTITSGSLSGGSTTTSYDYEYSMTFPDKLDTSAVAIAYKETTTDNGKTTVKWTDGKGHLVKEDSEGVTKYYKYDQSGNQVLELTPSVSGDRASMTLYDEKGNQFATIQNPTITIDNNVATYKSAANSILTRTMYYDNGKVKAEIDGKGVITYYTYDSMDKVTSVTENAVLNGNGELQSGGIQTNVTYPDQFTTTCTDAGGTATTQVVDAAGNTILTRTGTTTTNIQTTFDYDSQGRLIKETYKDNSFKSYEYNDKGLLTEVTTSKMVSGSPVIQTRVIYNYNSDNQLSDETDYMLNSSGEMAAYYYAFYEYNGLGRMTGAIALNQEAIPTTADKDSHRTSYLYNASGQVTEITYPLNTADEVKGLKYNYDSNGRITTVVAKVGTTDKTLRSYTYNNAFGEISAISDRSDFTGSGANIIQRSYTYDSFGRVLTMQYVKGTTTLESFTLTYDPNSNITSEVDGSTTKGYSYDNLNRLITVQTTQGQTTGTTNYTYDNAGNRLSKETATTRNEYVYNGLNQLTSMVEKNKVNGQFQQVASTAYTYDVKGNLTQDNETKGSVETDVSNTYTVDSLLAGTSIQVGTEDTLTQTNAYNGSGQRITKDENDTLSNYFYQGSNVLYTTDDSDTKTSQNLLTPVGSTIDSARYTSSDISYYLYNKDIRNSTASILNESGGFATKYSYDEFGQTTVDGSYTFANEICYTGGIYDWSSGQYYLNARYYDPNTGRFLSEDTYRGVTKDPDTWQLYAYCANNPVNYVDPSGHVSYSVKNLDNHRYKFIVSFSDKDIRKIKWATGVYTGFVDTMIAWLGAAGAIPSAGISVAAAVTVTSAMGAAEYTLDYYDHGKGAKVNIYLKLNKVHYKVAIRAYGERGPVIGWKDKTRIKAVVYDKSIKWNK